MVCNHSRIRTIEIELRPALLAGVGTQRVYRAFVGDLTDPIAVRYSGRAGLTTDGTLSGQREFDDWARPVAL